MRTLLNIDNQYFSCPPYSHLTVFSEPAAENMFGALLAILAQQDPPATHPAPGLHPVRLKAFDYQYPHDLDPSSILQELRRAHRSHLFHVEHQQDLFVTHSNLLSLSSRLHAELARRTHCVTSENVHFFGARGTEFVRVADFSIRRLAREDVSRFGQTVDALHV
jgi:hypothetical protein